VRFSGPLNHLALSLGKAFAEPAMVGLACGMSRRIMDPRARRGLLEYALRQKVIPQVYSNAARLLSTEAEDLGRYLLYNLEEEFTVRRHQYDEFFPRAVETVHETLIDAEVDHLFIKGVCLARFYAGVGVRQANDVDIVVRDLDALFASIEILGKVGFGVDFSETPWVARRNEVFPHNSADNRYAAVVHDLLGHVTVTRQHDAGALKVDIHVHNMTINEIGDTLTGDLWERASGIWPSNEDTLLILIAHAANHGFLRQRDCNDLFLLIKACGQELDWGYVRENAIASGIFPILQLCASVLSNHYQFPDRFLPTKLQLPRHRLGVSVASMATWLGPRSSLVAPMILQGLSTYLANRPNGRGTALRRFWANSRFLLYHKLSESYWNLAPIQKLLLRYEMGTSLLKLSPGQRVHLLDADGICNEELESVEAALDFLDLKIHKPKILAPNTFVMCDGGTELVIHPSGLFAVNNTGLFDEEEMWKLKRLWQSAKSLEGFKETSQGGSLFSDEHEVIK